MRRDEVAAWIALRATPGVGDIFARRLVSTFGGPEAAIAASPNELESAGARPAVVAAVRAARVSEHRAEADRIEAAGARLVAFTADDYPALLRQVHDAPPYLIVRGEGAGEGPAVAIVGSRRATRYGRDVAERLAEDLALAGVLVVSGLALGIDGAAHRGALRGGGPTVAVLGSGIDVIYPSQHRELARGVVENGLLVSELPIGTEPRPEHFPARNRIIAGMTLATVVVEAAARSGALITAQLALEMNREVFAVPGQVTSPLSEGPHSLLKQGAGLVSSADDILAVIAPPLRGRFIASAGDARDIAPAPDDMADLFLSALVAGPLGVDDLIRETGRAPSEVLSRMFELELRGAVRQLPGKQYELSRV